MQFFSAKRVNGLLDWPKAIKALRSGHQKERPQIADQSMQRGSDAFLCRLAWGLAGAGLKAVTIFPKNVDRSPALPSVQGYFIFFSAETGEPVAILDGAAITAWKTAADSALGADLLARPDVHTLTMVGAGAMAEALVRAHVTVRPSIRRILIWNRTQSRALKLLDRLTDLNRQIEIIDNLEGAVRSADLISCANNVP